MEEEQEEPQSITTTAAALSADPALQKKHQAMLDRLSNRHQPRQKSASSASTAAFLTQFSDSRHSIESQLAEASSSKLAADPSLMKSHMADFSSSISSLEQLVAENSHLLPPYELRSALKSISDLKQSLENLNPKKKFSFKSKSQNQTQKSSTAAQCQALNTAPAAPEQPAPRFSVQDSPGFRNKESQILAKSFKGSEIGEFTLSDLESCEVRLIGPVNALFINRLRNCRVYAGPVLGSVLIEQVDSCIFVLASHQIRIHRARESDFYLRVRSRPIIEDCGGVRFAPYCLSYDGIEDDLKAAGLEAETGNWANVDDFQWLRAVPSPNWSVLEETKRISSVEI
ncbi:hypothetical protein Tsubulata_020847 [Turnera subulata]|uniref:C-CAP/cofactor C-like domain-containing protein n=1 Tax=Turnera subulata TaxID=218843 RepID=A0A9Q0G4U0_9ROSI|nr:hypothetical protein Tsubulata_020847 [Turnera subulata]